MLYKLIWMQVAARGRGTLEAHQDLLGDRLRNGLNQVRDTATEKHRKKTHKLPKGKPRNFRSKYISKKTSK